MNEDFKNKYQFIYIPASRNLETELRVNNWTMLWKIMKKIHSNYAEFYWSEIKLKEEFSRVMEESHKFLTEDFSDELTFKKFSENFMNFCWENSAGLANKFEPELNIYNINWFYKTLQIQLNESFSDKSFDANEVGSGMQNLILISIFQTYAKLMWENVIFGIEEPEIYLYPQAQRGLYKSIQELSNNSQIFYTTHSQNFVDAYRSSEVQLVRKSNEGTNLLKKHENLHKILEQNKFKIYTNFNTERNELYFAKKILLVEWDTEKIIFSTLAERWWYDINNLWLSIIECWWKNWVIYFSGVCKLLGIKNCLSLWDSDNDKTPLNLKGLLDAWRWIEFQEDIESYINNLCDTKISISWKGNKIENAYDWAKSVELKELKNNFEEIKNFIWTINKENINNNSISIKDVPF
jgi:predicted ATP-dependent endonuclease of OLD family